MCSFMKHRVYTAPCTKKNPLRPKFRRKREGFSLTLTIIKINQFALLQHVLKCCVVVLNLNNVF